MKEHKKLRISKENIKDELNRVSIATEKKNIITSNFLIIIVVTAIAIIISSFFISVLQVTGNSMYPSLNQGDIVILLNSKKLSRGNIVAFYYQNKVLIKRVIGLPGDEINIDSKGNIFVNNEKIDEPYIQSKDLGKSDIEYPYQVPEESYFVIGDERETSIDSRNKEIGCIEKDKMIGKFWVKIWSNK